MFSNQSLSLRIGRTSVIKYSYYMTSMLFITTDVIDLFIDTTAILNCTVSNSFYGMLGGQIHTNLPPEFPGHNSYLKQ